MSEERRIAVTKLGDSNYSTWKGEMKAALMKDKCWRIVKGEATEPEPKLAKDHKEWEEHFDMAAGSIYLTLEPSQRVHVEGIDSDPVKMWKKLEEVHVQKRPAARFHAYDALLSIRQLEDESLTALMLRVDAALQRMRELRPDDATVDSIEEELACMTIIRALSQDHSSFVSALLLLPQLDKKAIRGALHNEQINRQAPNASGHPSLALGASASQPNC